MAECLPQVQVVVLPADAVEISTNAAVPVLAAVFLLVTLVTTLQANGVPVLVSIIAQDRTFITQDSIYNAVPGTLSTLAILGAQRRPAADVAAARTAYYGHTTYILLCAHRLSWAHPSPVCRECGGACHHTWWAE